MTPEPTAPAATPTPTPTPAELPGVLKAFLMELPSRPVDPGIELAVLKERIAIVRHLRENGSRECSGVIEEILDGNHHRSPDEVKRAEAIKALIAAADLAVWMLPSEVAKALGKTDDEARAWRCDLKEELPTMKKLREATRAVENL